MFTDLILCKQYFLHLGFDRILDVNIIDFNSKRELRKKLNNHQGLRIIHGSKENREVIELKKIDILLSPEKGVKKDSFHNRNSGLNHVICNLAKKNDIAIGFNFNEVLVSKGMKRAEIIGRMMQNVRLCRKYKLKMVLGSFAWNKWQMRSRNDLISFGIILGMHQNEAKNSLQAVNDIIGEKREKQNILVEGVKILDNK